MFVKKSRSKLTTFAYGVFNVAPKEEMFFFIMLRNAVLICSFTCVVISV